MTTAPKNSAPCISRLHAARRCSRNLSARWRCCILSGSMRGSRHSAPSRRQTQVAQWPTGEARCSCMEIPSLGHLLPRRWPMAGPRWKEPRLRRPGASANATTRSEEHTSELQSQSNLVCRLLLEKKKKKQYQLHVANKKKTNKENEHGARKR